MTPGLHAWRLDPSVLSAARHGCSAVRSIGLGIAMLGLSAGVSHAGPAGEALMHRAAFPGGVLVAADDPADAAVRGVSPSDPEAHQPQLPAVRLWDEVGAPGGPSSQGAATVTTPSHSGR